ncbi:cytochrome c biogenesis CcdA family protein [Undibacterium terreum]|uniref:Cytochrome C biogenesis protein CcdA n=1 Tax=Undibacterium terreum TaxID=1224302 RepID=A0A916U9P5_9BURK|nr:cytochrome c biogenesis CcdA family protein [Undibacterium terreum]GGC64236.1 cytochrome C biogenesis protein CcdA [Undibacterium terreum]
MHNLIEAPLALAAGILTIMSPCVLPMLPILLGTSAGRPAGARPVFVLAGFVAAFCALGMLLAFASNFATFTHEALRTVAIVALLLSGLMRIWPRPYDLLIAKIGNPFERFSKPGSEAAPSNAGGFFLGISLGAVWTPCAGPVLASILALVAQAQDVGWAASLLVLYAVGAAVPMLAVAYGGQLVTGRLRYLSINGHRIQQLFGVLVVLTAVAIYFQYDVLFSSWLLSSHSLKGL